MSSVVRACIKGVCLRAHDLSLGIKNGGRLDTCKRSSMHLYTHTHSFSLSHKTIDRTESAKGRGTNKGQIEIKKDEEKGKEGQRVIEAENW